MHFMSGLMANFVFNMADDSAEAASNKRGESQYSLKLKARQASCQVCGLIFPLQFESVDLRIQQQIYLLPLSFYRFLDALSNCPRKPTIRGIASAKLTQACSKWSSMDCMCDSANIAGDSKLSKSLMGLTNPADSPFSAIASLSPAVCAPNLLSRRLLRVLVKI